MSGDAAAAVPPADALPAVPPSPAGALPDDALSRSDPADTTGVIPTLQALVQPLWNAIVARFDHASGTVQAARGSTGAAPLGMGDGAAPPLPSVEWGPGAAAPGDAKSWADPADASGVVPLLQPLMQLWASLPTPRFEDVAAFRQETARADPGALPLDQVAAELSAVVGSDSASQPEGYSFDFEVAGFGRMEGHVAVRSGRAEVELRALQPAAAASLRQRVQQLQQMVDRETDGDVTLSIV